MKNNTQVIEAFVRNDEKGAKSLSLTYAPNDYEVPVLYSYGTVIASREWDGTIRAINQKFSVTTSKHQSILRRVLADAGYREVRAFNGGAWEVPFGHHTGRAHHDATATVYQPASTEVFTVIGEEVSA